MSSKERKNLLALIVMCVIIIVGIKILAIQSIELQDISIDRIIKGHETNLVNGEVAISIHGKGFKEGDKIYLNNQEARTAISDSTFLSFTVNKDLYKHQKDQLEMIVQLKRFTPRGSVILKSNIKKIKIITVEEKLNNTMIIDTITPEIIIQRQEHNLIDNKVAISILGKGFTNNDIMYINGKAQQTAFGSSEFLSCLIPRKFYNRPSKIKVQLKRIKDIEKNNIIEVSNEYTITVEEDSKSNVVWKDNLLIAHAMGAIEGKTYTNSYEAFISNYEKGIRVFEVDLIFTNDNHLVARHDWSDSLLKSFQQNDDLKGIMNVEDFSNEQIHGKFQSLTLEDIFILMKQYPDMYIVTDTKEVDEQKIIDQFNYIIKTAKQIDIEILRRVMPQIYTPEMFEIINNLYKWENVIYTLYQSYQTQDEVVEFLEEENITTVVMTAETASQEFIDKLLEKNKYIYVHTINDKETARKYIDMGVWGVYTDSLAEEYGEFK